MGKRKELEKELDRMAAILYGASENFEYFHYLTSPLPQDEYDFVEANSFLRHLRYLSWQMTVIELVKLVSSSENQKFNIFKLLKKFENGHYKTIEVHEVCPPLWEGSILKHGNTIVVLNEVRDRIYAHTDRDTHELGQKSFPILGIRELIHDLQSTLNFIAESTIGKRYPIPELYYLRKDFDLLGKLKAESVVQP